MNSQRYTANLLGALSLTLLDKVNAAVARVMEHGGETAAALVTISAEPNCTVGFVAKATGLSHSGTVRNVSKLVSDNLVVSKQGEDNRTVNLSVTPEGRDKVEQILKAREAVLIDSMAPLNSDQLSALTPILQSMISTQTSEAFNEHSVCRLCDTLVCYQDGCPLGKTEYQVN